LQRFLHPGPHKNPCWSPMGKAQPIDEPETAGTCATVFDRIVSSPGHGWVSPRARLTTSKNRKTQATKDGPDTGCTPSRKFQSAGPQKAIVTGRAPGDRCFGHNLTDFQRANQTSVDRFESHQSLDTFRPPPESGDSPYQTKLQARLFPRPVSSPNRSWPFHAPGPSVRSPPKPSPPKFTSTPSEARTRPNLVAETEDNNPSKGSQKHPQVEDFNRDPTRNLRKAQRSRTHSARCNRHYHLTTESAGRPGLQTKLEGGSPPRTIALRPLPSELRSPFNRCGELNGFAAGHAPPGA
jgi:hypothetical protein